jgi:hypothetical protein
VAQPQIDIGAAFSAAANAAVGATLSPSFSAYGSDALFYTAAFIFGELLWFPAGGRCQRYTLMLA